MNILYNNERLYKQQYNIIRS